MPDKSPLVLGIGNLVMGDEGIGVVAARRLEMEEGLPPGVTVVDGGTGGFHLLSYFSDYDPIILIDATLDGRPPGTVSVIEPRFLADFPRSLTAHDIGLRDMIESAALLGTLPKMFLVTVSVANLQPVGVIVTPEVEAAIPEVVRAVSECLRTHGTVEQ
jgi:hydrogenase maturation protease